MITDWDSFHQTYREVFDFPDFYGMNMNAWIDCLTYLDEGDGMSRFHLAASKTLNIEVSDTESFKSRHPETVRRFLDSSYQAYDRGVFVRPGLVPLVNIEKPIWINYLDGKISRAKALDMMVAAFVKTHKE